jgi:sterol desaturase/sphingolipid hydroxylase (fatty acid hydroxylase superfamily)
VRFKHDQDAGQRQRDNRGDHGRASGDHHNQATEQRRGVLLSQASRPAAPDRVEHAPIRQGGAAGRARVKRGPWLGVLAVASAAVWLGVIGWQTLSDGGDLWHSLAADRKQMVGPALVAVVAAVFLAERVWPAVQRPVLARAHLVDAGYLALFAIVVAPFVTLVSTGFGVEMQRYAHFLVLGRLSLVPRVVVVGLILIGIDAMNWLAHLANHRSAALWRLHALHHSQEDMSVFTTFRTHPLAHATYLPTLIPVLVLGAGGPVPAVSLVVYGCLVTLPHANLRWTFGPLGRIVVSPAYHRLHHARSPLDGRGAVNFGFVLVGWDRLAHLAAFPTGQSPIPTGISGRPVPIEQGVRKARTAGVILAQLTQPFVANAATDGPS